MSATEIVSAPYQVSAGRFVRVASEQWFRRMWPLYLLFIVVGVAALFLRHDPVWTFIGIGCLFWPMTVPLRMFRAFLLKKGKGREFQVAFEADRLRYIDPDGLKAKEILAYAKLNHARRWSGCFLLYTSLHHYVFIPRDAFTRADAEAIDRLLRDKRLLR